MSHEDTPKRDQSDPERGIDKDPTDTTPRGNQEPEDEDVRKGEEKLNRIVNW